MAARPEVIAAAKEYFKLGYQVVAIGQGKRPLGAGWRRAHTVEEIIGLLEGPAIGIGFLGGEFNSGIVPIDFDSPEGDAWFCAQCEKVGIDPFEFPMVVTPGKLKAGEKRRHGLHRYVRDIRGSLGNATGPLLASLGIDIRGRGHAMLPPSPHPDGGVYQWMLAHSLLTDFSNGVPPCPLFLYEAIEARYGLEGPAEMPREAPAEPVQGNGADPGAEASFRAPSPPGGGAGGSGGRGANYEARIRAYLQSAIANARDRLAAVTEGQPLPGGKTRGRNAALNNEALGLGHWAHHGIYSSGTALSALMAACETNGLLKDDGVKQCHDTFWSGWNDGLAEPKELKDDEPPRPGFGSQGAGTKSDWSAGSTDYSAGSTDYSAEGVEYSGEKREDTGQAKNTGQEILEIDVWHDDDEPIDPRGWLLGNIFCRQYLSALFAAGSTGKTALRVAQALELASGKPITGEHIFQRCRVLYICFEDNKNELKRRVRAARIHHGITAEEIKDWLYLATPAQLGLRLATIEGGQIQPGKLGPALEKLIRILNIDIVILDPFVKTHSVEENSNNHIDFVANILAGLAERCNIAVDTPHHVGKGKTEPGNAESGRGATAHKDAGRLIYTLTTMTPEEAELLGISDVERRFLIRMDKAKVNNSPPTDQTKWYRLIGVSLGNATTLYPAGDEVQTIEQYRAPGIWADVSPRKAREILLVIDKGLEDGRRYSASPKPSEGLAAWRVIQIDFPDKNEAQCRAMIRQWLKSKVLTEKKYRNPITRETAKGLYVDHEKLPSYDLSGEAPD